MRYTLLVFLILINSYVQSQSSVDPGVFAGDYSAMVNTDKVTLAIEPKGGTSYAGILYDGYTSLSLVFELAGTAFTGVGKEPLSGVDLHVKGRMEGDQLLFNILADPLSDEVLYAVIFTRDGSDVMDQQAISDLPHASQDFPSGATHPQEMLGTWTKEELYQSGYGDAYMGAGTSQSMTFLSGGRMAEAGSSSYISGSNYSGQSSGEGSGVIPGVAWYTIGNQLYMQVTENGQTQQVHLGKYYVENGNMLITGTNGEKILLSRKN